MHSSISPGRTSGRLAGVAGMGVLATSILFATSSWLSCSPGVLDCDSVSAQACGNAAGAGGTPGTGGTGGGGGAGPTITLATPISGCALPGITNVGEFETKFIAVRCGKAACHSTPPTFAPDMAAPEIFKRLYNKTVVYAATTCNKTTDKYIDPAGDPANSFLVVKVRDTMPKCPSGTAGGLQMPFNEMPGPNAGPLNEMEKACVVAYAKAVAGK
jgi:hypothetical protein